MASKPEAILHLLAAWVCSPSAPVLKGCLGQEQPGGGVGGARLGVRRVEQALAIGDCLQGRANHSPSLCFNFLICKMGEGTGLTTLQVEGPCGKLGSDLLQDHEDNG